MTALATLRTALCGAFVERSEIVDAMLTGTIAGEHTFILGPPGTAKSALVRVVSHAFGLRYWETLLTRFSTPEDVFGAVSLAALQRGSFERVTTHYLPNAEIGFLDEVWKANAGVLNALLTIANERVFHNDGVPVACPLVSLFGASNELPEGPELGALYDRFMVRLHVDYIADRGNFLAMMRAGEPSIPSVKIDIRAEQVTARAVTLGADVFEAIADTRAASQKAGFVVSDRRWRKSLSLIQASAHLDGRSAASPDDLAILEHSLWREPSERSAVSRLVQTVVNPNAAKAVECLDAAKEARAKLPADVGRKDLALVAECNATLLEIKARLDSLGKGKKIDTVRAEVARLHTETSKLASKAMGLSL